MLLTAAFAGRGKKTLFSASEICSALFAYLRFKYPENPRKTLRSFGIERSEDVGVIKSELAQYKKTGVAKLVSDPGSFAEIFTDSKVPDSFSEARWYEARIEDDVREEDKTFVLLKKHFGEVPIDSLVVTKRLFPLHVAADLHLGLSSIFSDLPTAELTGLKVQYEHDGLSFTSLLSTQRNYAVTVGPLIYDDIEVGEGEMIACLKKGLWTGLHNSMPYAVVLGTTNKYGEDSGKTVEIAVPSTSEGEEFAKHLVVQLERSMKNSKCYRGKILSFEQSSRYSGVTTGIKVHSLHAVEREQVILPRATVDLLDRNIIDFIEKRPPLIERGMSAKKRSPFPRPARYRKNSHAPLPGPRSEGTHHLDHQRRTSRVARRIHDPGATFATQSRGPRRR